MDLLMMFCNPPPPQGHAAYLRHQNLGLVISSELPLEGHFMTHDPLESAWNLDLVKSALRRAREEHDLAQLFEVFWPLSLWRKEW